MMPVAYQDDDPSTWHGLTWLEWMAGLDAEHERLRCEEPGFEGYGEGSLIDRTSPESWEVYFKEGYSPQGALAEDRSYWDVD